MLFPARCIVSNFYIKSQRVWWLSEWNLCCIVSNFYIKSQRCTMILVIRMCCIVSNFYIKSQLRPGIELWLISCIVSNFYIKSQPAPSNQTMAPSCIVSNFYIKSQRWHIDDNYHLCCIVSNFYIKSQPQALHLLIIRVLHPYVPRKKRCSANWGSRFDAVFPFCKTNISKKFQLLRYFGTGAFDPCPRNSKSRRIVCPLRSGCSSFRKAASICGPAGYGPPYFPWRRSAGRRPSIASSRNRPFPMPCETGPRGAVRFWYGSAGRKIRIATWYDRRSGVIQTSFLLQ